MRTAIVCLAAAAGFAGGLAGSRIATVHAQGPGPGVEILRSKSFVLLDASGRKRGEWRMDSNGQPVLRLFDDRGNVFWDTTGIARPRLTGGIH